MGEAALTKPAWMMAHWSKHLGLPGTVGLAFAAVAFAVFLGLILPAEAELEQATREVADWQSQLKRQLADPQRSMPVESSLDLFYKRLPPERNATEALKKIYKLANNESLFLAKGEYKFTRGKAGHMGNYQVTLPVKGSYVQVRKFIAKVLNGMPTVALDGVSFKRESIGGTDLEAKIQLTIFLGIA
jgi:Tfp pilus assembly protein PilO